MTMRHWMTYHRKKVKAWPAGEMLKQATAAAKLTEAEMGTLEQIGVQREVAWSDCKTLFCMSAPQT